MVAYGADGRVGVHGLHRGPALDFERALEEAVDRRLVVDDQDGGRAIEATATRSGSYRDHRAELDDAPGGDVEEVAGVGGVAGE